MNIWRVNYFALALGCSFPIVEAIYNNNVALTVKLCIVEKLPSAMANTLCIWTLPGNDYLIVFFKKSYQFRLHFASYRDYIAWSIGRGIYDASLRNGFIRGKTWPLRIQKAVLRLRKHLNDILIGLEPNFLEQELMLNS